MKFLSGLPVTMIAILAIFAGVSPDIQAQEAFPEAKGRDTLFLVCSQCHSLNRITGADLTSDDWEFILYDMISRGAPVHKEDIKALKKYLQDNFATEGR